MCCRQERVKCAPLSLCRRPCITSCSSEVVKKKKRKVLVMWAFFCAVNFPLILTLPFSLPAEYPWIRYRDPNLEVDSLTFLGVMRPASEGQTDSLAGWFDPLQCVPHSNIRRNCYKYIQVDISGCVYRFPILLSVKINKSCGWNSSGTKMWCDSWYIST